MNKRTERVVLCLYALRAFMVIGAVAFFAHQSNLSLRVAGLPERIESVCDGDDWSTSDCLAKAKAQSRTPASVPIQDKTK